VQRQGTIFHCLPHILDERDAVSLVVEGRLIDVERSPLPLGSVHRDVRAANEIGGTQSVFRGQRDANACTDVPSCHHWAQAAIASGNTQAASAWMSPLSSARATTPLLDGIVQSVVAVRWQAALATPNIPSETALRLAPVALPCARVGSVGSS
jgi:hypothetical protein